MGKNAGPPEDHGIPNLVAALKDAVAELEGRAGEISTFSHYASFQEFADHLRGELRKVEAGEENFREVYEIFLPTSDWDDAGGSPAVANRILDVFKYLR